jgi:hypothetical protein
MGVGGSRSDIGLRFDVVALLSSEVGELVV